MTLRLTMPSSSEFRSVMRVPLHWTGHCGGGLDHLFPNGALCIEVSSALEGMIAGRFRIAGGGTAPNG